MVKISEIFFTYSQTNILQYSTVTCVQKKFQKKIDKCTRNGSFGAFFCENIVKNL